MNEKWRGVKKFKNNFIYEWFLMCLTHLFVPSNRLYKVRSKIEFRITSFPSLKMKSVSLLLCLTGLALSQGGNNNTSLSTKFIFHRHWFFCENSIGFFPGKSFGFLFECFLGKKPKVFLIVSPFNIWVFYEKVFPIFIFSHEWKKN